MLGLLERLAQGATEPVVRPPQVPALVVGVPAALEVALADDDQGLTPTIRSYVFRSSREGASFQTIVSAAREAELLEQDDFGGPKRVRTGGWYSCTSSGGRGPHRGGGFFQRQRPVHASLPAIEGGPAARAPPGLGSDFRQFGQF
ncbi:hypothetical protein H5410_032454 [Solanum commersonii]|uniref:Uncharacterized protein n=1 Tax=Solanum commersonii TaxID=4109 RepID=A0A9J5YPP3_SOLCO|nr:hypothetical protein H5410_032454 [Solanum commersonii]